MSSEFNVFDEWGNKVGEYTPTGGSGVDGLIMIVAMIFFWTIGFAVYTFVRLTMKGLEALTRREYLNAFKYLLVPGFVILTILMQIGFVTIGS